MVLLQDMGLVKKKCIKSAVVINFIIFINKLLSIIFTGIW